MEEITILDMTLDLKITSDAVKRRLQRKGIRPFRYIGPTGIYRKADLEAIRDAGVRGRPRVEPDSKPAPKAKAKKTDKKK